jgi:hypothetical protein
VTVLSAPRAEPVWAAQGWEVLTVSTPGGVVRTQLDDDGLWLQLGDLDAHGRPGPVRTAGTTTARFGPAGAAWLQCVSAPPVLWLGAGGHRLAPQVPSGQEDVRLAPGDLLVLCSADVLEHLDRGLPHLAELTDGLGDPGLRARALADDLGAATPAGAAAVAVWSPVVAHRGL